MAQSKHISKIIIVGAGPSGLVLALLLAKEGIKVELLDAGTKLDESPRASHYAAPAIHELTRAGVIDEIRAEGFIPNGVSWRKLDQTRIAGISMQTMPQEQKMVCLPLNRMCKILVEHIKKYPNVELKWSHNVVSIGQDADKAWVEAETPSGNQRFEAAYIVGCDGANSVIRRKLFGDWEFPGRTWEEQIVATNVYIGDYLEKYNLDDSNFYIHKDHWSMIAKIQTDGLYRITYGELPGLTLEQLKERQVEKYKSFIPGAPEPDQYKIVNFSPYKIHQRCAESLRVGRFLLGADAAHLCNPFGGMGLTGGLVDIGNLYDCFYCINEGLSDDSILTRYDEVRRQIYHNIIDTVSSDNIRRLWQDPDTAGEKDPFLLACKRAETDPAFEKEMQKGILTIMHDFRAEVMNKKSQTNETVKSSNDTVPTTVATTAVQ